MEVLSRLEADFGDAGCMKILSRLDISEAESGSIGCRGVASWLDMSVTGLRAAQAARLAFLLRWVMGFGTSSGNTTKGLRPRVQHPADHLAELQQMDVPMQAWLQRHAAAGLLGGGSLVSSEAVGILAACVASLTAAGCISTGL